jgi:hypothetical protein
MTNQTQDPTPEQEAMHEMQCEIEALKEQIVEAHRLLTDSIKDVSYEGYLQWKIDRQFWIDQNETIVKERAK